MSTSNHTFLDFFEVATGNQPYLWQCRLACGEPPSGGEIDIQNPDQATKEWLAGDNPCASRLIDIPTGLGKTAGVVLAWLWNRTCEPSVSESQMRGEGMTWPRRLVYCLPMRTLVEQTEGEARNWICRLEQAGLLPSTHQSGKPRVIVLMGGENLEGDEKDWDLYPEDPAIIIGTQDIDMPESLLTADPYFTCLKLTPEQQKLARTLAADGLSIQDRFRPEPLYKKTGKGHYESQTLEDIQKAKQKEVVETNRLPCTPKNALQRFTSVGHAET
ncbi:MAG: hypothetical protein ACFCU3_09350, partial [Verrucomicrobiales bacterium]